MALKSKIVTVTPVTDVSATFASGDQMTDVFTITDALDRSTGKLVSLVVVDKDKIGVSLDVLLFNASPTVTSVKNGAFDISDAEMGTKYIGRVSVPTWNTNNVNSDATVLQSACGLKVQSSNGSQNLYGILVCKGTPGGTFVSASALVLKFGFEQD